MSGPDATKTPIICAACLTEACFQGILMCEDARRAGVVYAQKASAPAPAAEVVTEYVHQMSGGGFHVWNTEPYILKIYPLAEKIRHGRRHGGKVYRRRVIVVEDWEEVTEP